MNKQRIYNINGNDFMTIKGACSYLGIKRPTMYAYIRLGYFTTLKIEGVYFIDFSELVERRKRLSNKA